MWFGRLIGEQVSTEDWWDTYITTNVDFSRYGGHWFENVYFVVVANIVVFIDSHKIDIKYDLTNITKCSHFVIISDIKYDKVDIFRHGLCFITKLYLGNIE